MSFHSIPSWSVEYQCLIDAPKGLLQMNQKVRPRIHLIELSSRVLPWKVLLLPYAQFHIQYGTTSKNLLFLQLNCYEFSSNARKAHLLHSNLSISQKEQRISTWGTLVDLRRLLLQGWLLFVIKVLAVLWPQSQSSCIQAEPFLHSHRLS